jgi:hypothetical protein
MRKKMKPSPPAPPELDTLPGQPVRRHRRIAGAVALPLTEARGAGPAP